MPRAKESLKIEVAQSTDADARTVTITLTAAAKDFMLPDLLSQRGVIEAFDLTLKRTVRETTERYLAGTEDLIAGLAADQKQEQTGEEPRPKAKLDGGKKSKSTGRKREAKPVEDSMISISTEPDVAGPPGSISGNSLRQ